MKAIEMAMHLWPMWMLGLFMVGVTIRSGNADLLRVTKNVVLRWVAFLFATTVIRAVMFFFAWHYLKDQLATVSWLPWQTTLMVWWEDAAHTLPLLLLARLIGTSKKTWPVHTICFLAIWLSFMCGHLYQGIGSAMLISMYIPITLKLGRKYGIGTMMVCHILYDLTTLLLIQTMLKVMNG